MERELAVAIVLECKTKVLVSRKRFSHEGVAEVLMFFCQVNRVCDRVAEGQRSHLGAFHCLPAQVIIQTSSLQE